MFEVDNGIHLQNKIQKDRQPDLNLMDKSVLDGFLWHKWVKCNFPYIKILVAIMNGHEKYYTHVKFSVNGYVTKDVDPAELKSAPKAVMNGKITFQVLLWIFKLANVYPRESAG